MLDRDLLTQANRAYDRVVALGPFYGKDIKDQNPSFRMAAEPVRLPFRREYGQLGNDIAKLGETIPSLPKDSLDVLGKDWTKLMPFLWRIDSIVAEDGRMFVNEVQISDGCDGRMTGLQKAYGLGEPKDTTPGAIVDYVTHQYGGVPNIAFIRHDIINPPYVSNNRRMQEYLQEVGKDRANFTMADKTELATTDWTQFDGVINYAFVRVQDLVNGGIKENQIICPGDTSYLGSKGLFALLHDSSLAPFWQERLGDAFGRLKNHFIKSELVKSSSDITNARDSGAVVKVFNTDRLSRLGAARGVFGPWDDSWDEAYSHLDQGSGLIAQEFVRPKKLPMLVRASGGRSLRAEELYNKVAVKYVSNGDRMVLTGVECTLGEREKPAGKGCVIVPATLE